MIELHLVGYTAELGHLVLDLAGADGGRYRLVVDEDLFATIDELREQRRVAGLPVGDLTEFADELGLSTDELLQVEDAEAAAAVAAGQVSAGSALADRVTPAAAIADGWDEDEPEDDEPGDDEPGDDQPEQGEPDEALDEVEDGEVAVAAGREDGPDGPTSAEGDDADDDAAGDGEAGDGEPEDDADHDDAEPAGGHEEDVARPPSPPAGPPTRTWDFDEGADSDGAAPPEPAGSLLASGWDDEDDDRGSAVRVVPRPVASAPPPAEEEPPRWAEDDGLVVRLLDEQADAGGRDRVADVAPPSDADPVPDDQGPGPADDPGPTSRNDREGDGEDVAPAEAPDPAPPPPPPPPEPTETPDTTSAAQRPEPLAVPDRRDGDRRTPPRPLTPDVGRRETAPATRPGRRDAPPAPRPEAALSPAQIQGRLRAGDSVRTVAKAAGVDVDWIRRWEAPILAERARVLAHAQSLRLERPRLGRSARPLGDAVARNLRAKGVDADDIAWEVSRRRDGRWRVAVRYVSRGRKRSATWTHDADADDLRAASDNARELGFVRRRR